MRAALLTGFGGPERLELRKDAPEPHAGAGEVRVRVAACGLNNTDIWTRIGAYGTGSGTGTGTGDAAPAGPKRTALRFPRIQGADVVGTIDEPDPAAGDPARVPVGTRVLVEPTVYPPGGSPLTAEFLGSDRDGGYAEYVVVPAANAHPIRSSLSDVELASFPVAYSTALRMLERVELAAGDRLLVTGATGGVGSALVQLGAVAGAEVTALTRRLDRAERLFELGASSVVDAAPAPDSIDVAADVVGGALLGGLLEGLRKGGRYVVAGAIDDHAVAVDLRTIYLKHLTLFGTSLATHENFRTLVALIEAGRLEPLVDRVYPLHQVHEAQAAFVAKDFFGKIVLDLT